MNDRIIEFFTDTTVFGISILNLLLALAVAALTFLATRAAISFLLRRVQRWSEHDGALSQVMAKVLSGTSNFLLFLASVLVGLSMLDLPERWLSRVGSLWFVVAALQIGLWVNRAIGLGLNRYFARHSTAGLNQGSALATLAGWGARVLLWSVVLLAMLSNLGVNITAFVASLGVGGIAVALAVQNILGDLFASLAIAVDKPFEVGDFIVIGALAGTVEQVGLKTTRIRSLGGEQIVMANASMISSTIQNYKRLQERRIVFEFGLSYDTPTEAVKKAPAIVEEAIKAQEQARFDRAHLRGFGKEALEFECVYIVKDPGYNLYMDIQQAINFRLLERFSRIGAKFAVPVRAIKVTALPQGADALGQGIEGRGFKEA
ncbi:mechanosensitive ion channel family protein [Pseudomonas putida]|jgi:small-conductance mechanosensitive channel|uniref:mechanosensitive ion channel family protein n=1 Tax=Pseudomonas TaxID=286 RepID=UPI00062A054C|nr:MULTISPECIES: mechanosensitive ion channel family protein [Pseudomonas]QPN47622.1 mechanosensitive ion channel family protein [Priestia aryabhattai]MBG6123407.1 small-conductance mechanosensitive channel [Pseudomonas sp. M2]MBM7395722.1 small-conductance mechanosensitive channel [Pseudomonas sp. M5]NSX19462.1 mechanosensitive ion channel family protein [Pseudomonas putida]RRV49458.1 mechanosensitive ion channel family protein [Pseudomonas sp. p106]